MVSIGHYSNCHRHQASLRHTGRPVLTHEPPIRRDIPRHRHHPRCAAAHTRQRLLLADDPPDTTFDNILACHEQLQSSWLLAPTRSAHQHRIVQPRTLTVQGPVGVQQRQRSGLQEGGGDPGRVERCVVHARPVSHGRGFGRAPRPPSWVVGSCARWP